MVLEELLFPQQLPLSKSGDGDIVVSACGDYLTVVNSEASVAMVSNWSPPTIVPGNLYSTLATYLEVCFLPPLLCSQGWGIVAIMLLSSLADWKVCSSFLWVDICH